MEPDTPRCDQEAGAGQGERDHLAAAPEAGGHALVEEALRLNEARLEALLRLNQMSHVPLQELALFAMEEAVRLTGSTVGYIAFANEDESVLTMHAWSRNAMQECLVAQKPIEYPVASTGLWGEAVRQRRPIITNDYAAPSPLKRGLPGGHVMLHRHLNVPVFDGDRIVIVAGVGNKADAYDNTDVRQLTLLMSEMWRIVQHQRAARAVEAKSEELDRFFDVNLDMLCIADTQGRFRKVNREWERTLGWRREELEGRSFLDLVHPDDRARTLAEIARLAGQQDVLDFVNRYRCSDGSYRFLEWRSTPAGDRIYAAARDITRRVDAEAALARSEERYRLLAETAEDVIVIADIDGRIDYVNPAGVRLSGYTLDELACLNIRDLIVPERRPAQEARTALRRAGDTSVFRVETELVGKHGQRVPFEVASSAMVADGKVVQVLSIARDISERKRAEEKLARTEALLRAAIEQSPAGILIADATSGHVFLCNAAALAIRGAPPRAPGDGDEETHLQPWPIFMPDGVTPFPAEELPLARALRRGEVSRGVDAVIRRDDGELRWVSANAGPIRDERGEIVAAIVVFHDITEHRRVEAALRESEQRLRELLESMHLAAVIVDLDGRITFCNEQLAKLTGWPREELQGRDWLATVAPETAHGPLDATLALAAGGQRGSVERPLLTRSGERRLVAWDITPLRNAAGAVLGAAGLGRDVTDLRRLEEQYRQAQKMEAVGQLAGGVAHDFNNILQVISGNLELLALELDPTRPAPPELAEATRAASRAGTLVRQLLTFSRRQTMRCERVDLDQVITNLAKMLRRVIGEHIDLKTVSRGALLPIWADPGNLEQVLMNLCVNARDAMPEGGTIVVETASVTLDVPFVTSHPWARPGEWVQLTVTDTGVGMAPEVREHIFEPFFTTKAAGKGTGLGLATVYGIVKGHGGFIDIYSEPGCGTACKIYLPALPGEGDATVPVQAPLARAPGGHETVLLAEDDEQVRTLAEKVLERAGYRVLVAPDGEKAIALLDKLGSQVDLFILDAVMPKASGRLVHEAIKAHRPHARVLFCSGYSLSSLEASGQASPPGEILQKPFGPQELLRRVREVLDAPPR